MRLVLWRSRSGSAPPSCAPCSRKFCAQPSRDHIGRATGVPLIWPGPVAWSLARFDVQGAPGEARTDGDDKMSITRFTRTAAALLALSFAFAGLASANGLSIYQATLMEPDAKIGEVSTEQLRRMLADGSATIIDARPRAE